MKITSRGLFALFVLSLGTASLGAESSRVRVQPDDHGGPLSNPGMGWVFHHFDNSIRGYGPPLGPDYAGEGFPGLSVAYLRLGWSYIEPAEGKFDWSVVDDVAHRYIQNGRRIALRLTCFESEIRYATPRWVKDAGAKGYWWQYGKGRVENGADPAARWEPDYDDPVFLEKLENFLAAAGARYDDNPNVAFVDVGSIGIWGEGNPVSRRYDLETYKRHIDLHRKHFPNTLLVAQDDWRPGPMRPAFDKPAEVRSAFQIDWPWDKAPDEHFEVLIGLWDPKAKGLPHGRLLPDGGREDRRISVGLIQVDERGEPSFDLIAKPTFPSPGADYEWETGKIERRGRSLILPVRWTILRDPPPGTTPFCHLEQDGRIVHGAGLARTWSPVHDYALRQGLTLRDDSVMWRKGFSYNTEWMADRFWPDRPVIIESGHYSLDIWGDGETYLDAMEDYHASYVSIHGDPRVILRNHAELIERMNRRMGYRLQLVEASWPRQVIPGGLLAWEATWRNAGVAPFYQGGHPTVTIVRADETVGTALTDERFDLNTRKGDAAIVQSCSFHLPDDMPTGEFNVLISVGERDGEPRIMLPLEGDDGRHRYTLGRITVTERSGP